MKPAEERAYIQQARADPRAFVHLYDHYFPRIHAYVRYRVRSGQDAEDIVAEVFLKAMRRLRGFKWRHEHSFATWIFRIAHNLIIDYYRRSERIEVTLDPRERAPESATPLPSRAARPEEALIQQQTFQQMQTLIETLSPRRREVITLRFFGGLRNKEIAGILNLDERTVASHLSRGLQDLRDRYTALTDLTAQTSWQVLEEVHV